MAEEVAEEIAEVAVAIEEVEMSVLDALKEVSCTTSSFPFCPHHQPSISERLLTYQC